MKQFRFYSDQSTEGKIVASLERISQAFRVLLWQESKKYSLTPLQLQILLFLYTQSEEKRKVSYLAGEFNVTKASMSETIKKLEQKGLIVKEDGSTDARSYIIHLAERGIEIAEDASGFAKEIYTPIAQLGRDEKKSLLLSLIKIIGHLNKREVVSVLRMCTTCSYYQPSVDENTDFCALLNQSFHHSEVRVDCQVHNLSDFPVTTKN